MREILKKYYLGAWQNIYHVNWPVRFFMELVFLIVAGFWLVKLISWGGKKLRVNVFLVKGLIWIVTEIVHFVGNNSEWAIDTENRMIDWGNAVINRDKKKRISIVKIGICFGVVVIYFLAVFVDLPIAKYLSGYYLEELEKVKSFCQKFEIMASKDYEKYPPLFVKIEKEEFEEAAEEVAVLEDQEPVYIRLNERGKRGSNIRSETNLDNDNNIIGGVNENSDILYCDKWEHDGERYWIRVYIPVDDIEGWLSGNLIDSEQLEEITGGG